MFFPLHALTRKYLSSTFVCVLFLLFNSITKLNAQPHEVLDAARLKLALEKLNVLGSVLYVAAHPDDENTSVLSYFSSGRLLRTGYLSITRGDGGQNLIGSEQDEVLGVIRTQELLAARRIDGAEQFFTRAIDFGYSKSPEETLEIWDKQKVLSDVVWIIRKFKPDVIITRFPANGEGGHGHHTSSSILAEEAFKLAADPTAFPDQLKYVEPWQARRIYWNCWLSENMSDLDLIKIDLGSFNKLLGKSYTEIAAKSRTMHKSQGFGSMGRRGELFNYFCFTAGEKAENDLMDNIDLSWKRVNNGEKINAIIKEANEKFDPQNPAGIIPLLLNAYDELLNLKNEFWPEIKKKELLEVIRSAAGLWTEAVSDDFSATPGDSLRISAGTVNRSDFPLILKKVQIKSSSGNFDAGSEIMKDVSDTLLNGEFSEHGFLIKLPENINYSEPYWLVQEKLKGSYQINGQNLIGQADNFPPLTALFYIDAGKRQLIFEEPVQYRRVDPVDGEIYRPFAVIPEVSINIGERVYIFPDTSAKEIFIRLRNNKNSAAGTLKLILPPGWSAKKTETAFNFDNKGDEKLFSFIINPPGEPQEGKLEVVAEINGKVLNKGMRIINHDHIPVQTLLPESAAKLIRLDTRKEITNIGYIMGSGDEIPQYLGQLGYNVTMLDEQHFSSGKLNSFDAVITGVRAYNTQEQLNGENQKLMEYVNQGGTLVVQYNVNRGLVTDQLGPWNFNISRERVTDENAPVTVSNKEHQLLNYPNFIAGKDFNNWIQERGLYFADSWDPRYETVFSTNDEGETPLKGGLLFARYGKGVFIYTGFSWFRQLPAGVPGAYRIFINLISAGKYKPSGLNEEVGSISTPKISP